MREKSWSDNVRSKLLITEIRRRLILVHATYCDDCSRFTSRKVIWVLKLSVPGLVFVIVDFVGPFRKIGRALQGSEKCMTAYVDDKKLQLMFQVHEMVSNTQDCPQCNT